MRLRLAVSVSSCVVPRRRCVRHRRSGFRAQSFEFVETRSVWPALHDSDPELGSIEHWIGPRLRIAGSRSTECSVAGDWWRRVMLVRFVLAGPAPENLHSEQTSARRSLSALSPVECSAAGPWARTERSEIVDSVCCSSGLARRTSCPMNLQSSSRHFHISANRCRFSIDVAVFSGVNVAASALPHEAASVLSASTNNPPALGCARTRNCTA